MDTHDEYSDVMTTQEVADELGVDDSTVRRWIRIGALEAVSSPVRGKQKGYRIKKATLDTLLNKQQDQ